MVDYKDAVARRAAAVEREAAEQRGKHAAVAEAAAKQEMHTRIYAAVENVEFIMAFLKHIAPDLRAGKKLSPATINKLVEIRAGEKLGINHLLSLDQALDREDRKQSQKPTRG